MNYLYEFFKALWNSFHGEFINGWIIPFGGAYSHYKAMGVIK
jgi:hypothetical protein